MKTFHKLLLAAALCCAVQAWPQQAQHDPHIGYAYPAGGRQGESIRILVGGQYLRGANSVHISGDGVQGEVIHCYQPIRNINGDQRNELLRRLWDAWETRRAELPEEERKQAPTAQAIAPGNRRKPAPATSERAKLPDHPLFNNIESMNLYQLAAVMQEAQNLRKRQPNAQLAELVEVELRIAPDAAPGDRELRLGVRNLFTNPLRFQIGALPETREQEPNDPVNRIQLPETSPLTLPVMLNGQIKPGDVDRFYLQGKQGQQIVVAAAARHLIPYLADAVPGWFQAVAAIYDADGNELAYADDYFFNPDPVLVCSLPKDDTYTLEIRDAIYRGRDDFVYRIAVGELPFITHVFPLGGRMETETVATIGGYNLPVDKLPLDTSSGTADIKKANLPAASCLSNDVFYAVNDLPECLEMEPNNAAEQAQQIAAPVIVNGRIEVPGDVDIFFFEGQAGDEMVAEVVARRLHSPMDSLLWVMDANGNVLAWNDDYKDKLSEIHTHHADSKVMVTLPENGRYHVQISDAQRNGGPPYAYRLHVRKALPDFALLATPSTLNIPAGRAVAVCVHAVRREGFEGDITLSLANAPKGFRIDGGSIPANRDSIRVTITAPLRPIDSPLTLEMEGAATIGGETVVRRAVPAEDMMQAFLPRHLVPTQQLLASVVAGPRNAQVWREGARKTVALERGGKALVSFTIPKRPKDLNVFLELDAPPDGFSLGEITWTPDGLLFVIQADDTAPDAGYEDNLIVSAAAERPVKQKDGSVKQTRVPLGALPAIPIKITH